MRERGSRSGRKYAAIPNAAMRDNRISAEARGCLALLMTFSDDWHFQRDHLMELLNMGRDKFQKTMKELAEAGYVELVAVRGEGGRVAGTEWIIRDDPEEATESLKNRSSVDAAESLKNRQPVKPTAGKSGPLRKPIEKENQKEENQQSFEPDFFDAEKAPSDSTKPTGQKADEAFDEFWSAYPKKTGKPAALKNWRKAVKAGADPQAIIDGARRYARSESVQRGFVKHPQGWLTDERWNDSDLPPLERPRSEQDWREVIR